MNKLHHLGSALLLACTLLLTACQAPSPAATSLAWFTPNSQVASDFVAYVNDVCDEKSPHFVPVADRIAVFDLDGTLMGETYPSYFDWVMFTHRCLHDPSYQAPADMKKFARALEDGWKSGKLPKDAEKIHAAYAFQSFRGLTPAQVRAYARDFMSSEAEGFVNLRRGEAFYKPMVALFKFLQEHDFSVFVVSGTERNIVRELISGVLDIPEDRVIGSDGRFEARNQKGRDGLDYVYQPEDELIYTGDIIVKNVKMNKVAIIAREIGKVPLLAFGNSSGDLSMAQYVVNDKRYPSRAYILLGDDPVREHANLPRAEKLAAYCAEHGFHTISMKNDFATIYGDAVQVAK